MASYPESQLTEGEDVLVHDHPHPKVLILPGLALVSILIGCGYLAVVTADWSIHQVVWIALAVVAAIAALWLGLAPWLRWHTTHFVITNQKVMFREGILTRTGLNIPVSRISSVRTEIDLNDRLFGCGSLLIEAFSDEPLRFTDIPQLEDVHNLLYQAVDGDTHLTPLT